MAPLDQEKVYSLGQAVYVCKYGVQSSHSMESGSVFGFLRKIMNGIKDKV